MAAPPHWLVEDLKTDWVPDALGGYGTTTNDGDGPGDRMVVATSRGPREVALAPLSFRVHASKSVELCLMTEERRLSSSVFGYRDLSTPYRDEWRRAQERRATLSAVAPEVYTDIRGFFSEVSL